MFDLSNNCFSKIRYERMNFKILGSSYKELLLILVKDDSFKINAWKPFL